MDESSNLLELLAVDMTNAREKKSKNKHAKINDLSTRQMSNNNDNCLSLNGNAAHRKQDFMCDGFIWETNSARTKSVSTSAGSDISDLIGNEQINQYRLIGKNVQFVNEPLVCLSIFNDVPFYSATTYFKEAKYNILEKDEVDGISELNVKKTPFPKPVPKINDLSESIAA